MLAVADPSDSAAVRAAAIVLGEDVGVSIASFEDIETALDQRLIDEDVATPGSGDTAIARDDDIESLRDLASGAPVVRAVSDLLEKAVELRASDIHIEPFRAGTHGANASSMAYCVMCRCRRTSCRKPLYPASRS